MKTLSDIPFYTGTKILFENERFFVVNKEAGVLSHPNSPSDQNAIIVAPYDEKGEFYRIGDWKVFLLHRIDKETSGCLLFAKDSISANKVKADFESHKIHKEYVALITGVIQKPTVWKDNLIKKSGKVFVDQRGKPNAQTRVQPLEIYKKSRMTLVKFIPSTGKTHQLRVQSSSRHISILGDRVYGNFTKNKDAKSKWNLNRMFLHSTHMEFTDSGNRKKISVDCSLPEELQSVLDSMEIKK